MAVRNEQRSEWAATVLNNHRAKVVQRSVLTCARLATAASGPAPSSTAASRASHGMDH